MGRKTVALSLNESFYEKYQKFYEENPKISPRKVEDLMKKN